MRSARRPLLCLAVALALASGIDAAAQEPPVEEIVESIKISGGVHSVIRHLTISGCPSEYQERIIEAVTAPDIPPRALGQLSGRWFQFYRACDSVPLRRWFASSLEVVAGSGDGYALRWFINGMPGEVFTPAQRETLWAYIEQRPDADWVTLHTLPAAAVRGRNEAETVELTLEAIEERNINSHWVFRQTLNHIQEHKDLFLSGLLARSASISDERLATILRAAEGAVGQGWIETDDPLIGELRARVAERGAMNRSARV